MFARLTSRTPLVHATSVCCCIRQVLKATLIDPTAKWQEAMKLLGRNETNFVQFEPFGAFASLLPPRG